jgi:hypothetical protein
MPINLKPMTVSPGSAGGFLQAQRQQAMADMLRQQALGSRVPTQSGPVAVKMGLGEGLTQLGQALLARKAQRKADQSLDQAATQQTESRQKALAQLLSPQTPGSVAQTDAPNDQTVVRPNQPRSYEQLLADSLAASEAGVSEDIIGPYLEAHAPTEKIKTLQQAGFTPEQIAAALKGSAEKDAYIAPVTMNGVGFDPRTHQPIMSAPDPSTGIQQLPAGDGTFAPYQAPGYNAQRAGTAAATKYAEEAASLQPELVNARAGQAGAIQGAQQTNTVFPNQTITNPDGSVSEGVPVWGGQIPGVGGQAPSGAQFGSDPKKRQVEAQLAEKDLEFWMNKANALSAAKGSLERISQLNEEGALGVGPLQSAQRGAHKYLGLQSRRSINDEQIQQLGSQLVLSHGNLGVGVSNYDAQTYAKAAGDFTTAKSAESRRQAVERMLDSADTISHVTDFVRSYYEQRGQMPSNAEREAVSEQYRRSKQTQNTGAGGYELRRSPSVAERARSYYD